MTLMTQPLVLTIEDKMTPLWKKLMVHWQDRMELLRNQNDGDQSDIQTAKLRGRIAEVRTALALDRERQDIE